MGGNGGGVLSQFVPVCLCRHRGGTSGGVARCLLGWQADWLAGLPAEMTVWVGGGVSWSVISVMICMDVSLSGSGTRL